MGMGNSLTDSHISRYCVFIVASTFCRLVVTGMGNSLMGNLIFLIDAITFSRSKSCFYMCANGL